MSFCKNALQILNKVYFQKLYEINKVTINTLCLNNMMVKLAYFPKCTVLFHQTQSG